MSDIPDSEARGGQLWASQAEVKVKVCRIESLEVAHDATVSGVDALGYHIMNPATALEKARMYRDLIAWLPPSVANVLVTRLTDSQLISEVCREGGFDSIQLQIDLDPEQIEDVRRRCRRQGCEIRIIKTIWMGRQDLSPGKATERYLSVVDAFLMDSGTGEKGGLGRTHDWSRCRELMDRVRKPFVLAGGLNSENVGEAISVVRPFGVDVQTGVEDTVRNLQGEERKIKSVRKIVQFVEAVKGKRGPGSAGDSEAEFIENRELLLGD